MALGDFLFPHLEATLIIARSFESDIEGKKNKLSEKYLESTARAKLNRNDLQRLSLKDGSNVSIVSDEAEVTVRAFGDENTPEGMAVMPYGPWALSLIDTPEDGKPLQLHGLKVIIKRSEGDVTPLQNLFSFLDAQ